MITLEQAKALRYGQTVLFDGNRNRKGEPQRWKVNGQPKTWKRSPERVQVPVKHGLYTFDYITEDLLDKITLE